MPGPQRGPESGLETVTGTSQSADVMKGLQAAKHRVLSHA